MEIIFIIQVEQYRQELTFQLPLKQKSKTNYIQSTKSAPSLQISPQIVVNGNIYNNEGIREEDDYPDVAYSTKPNIQIYQNHQIELSCECLLDHNRINKIESNSKIIKNENEKVRQRINDLKMKIEMIKKQTKDIRGENGVLNMKTLELKKEFNNLLEAEAALRAENDDLKKEKHELILKK